MLPRVTHWPPDVSRDRLGSLADGPLNPVGNYRPSGSPLILFLNDWFVN